MRNFNPWPAFEKKVPKIQEMFGIVNNHGLAWAKWTTIIVVFHSKGQSLTVLPFSCSLFDVGKCTCGNRRWLPHSNHTNIQSTMIPPEQIIWTPPSSSRESHSPPCHPLQRHVKSISLFKIYIYNQPKDFKDDCLQTQNPTYVMVLRGIKHHPISLILA